MSGHRPSGKSDLEVSSIFIASDDPWLQRELSNLATYYQKAFLEGKFSLATLYVKRAVELKKRLAEIREAVLKRVIEAGGSNDYTVFDIKRYAEELGGNTLQKLEEMDGLEIKRVIEREIEKVYKLRPCP